MRLNEIKPMLDMSIYYFTLHSSLALSTFTQHKRAHPHYTYSILHHAALVTSPSRKARVRRTPSKARALRVKVRLCTC